VGASVSTSFSASIIASVFCSFSAIIAALISDSGSFCSSETVPSL